MELELNMFSNGFTPTATAKTKEKAKEKTVKKQDTEQDEKLKALVKEVHGIYIDGYLKRYKVAPDIEARFNTIVKRLVKEKVENAPAIMKCFIDSNNPHYVNSSHDERLLARDVKTLWRQVQQQQQGIPVTEAFHKSKAQELRETMAGMHHNFGDKNYDAGVDENGHLI